ncbi:MAG: glycosyltransferase family 2 protein [Gammaproteobacteria bacterium]
MKKLSVVTPVYYNELSLAPLFEKLQYVESELAKKSIEFEIIFVYDGSGDNSFDELKKIKQKRPATKLVKLTRNFGAVQAAKEGLKYVTGDCYVYLAADLQDPPEAILEMADNWLAGSKYVIVVRKGRSDPFLSVLFSKIYYKLVRLMVDKNYPATGFDMALMDKCFLPHTINCGKNAYTPFFSYSLGFKPTIIYHERKPRIHGKSRWTFNKRIKIFLDSLLGFSFVPIRLISFVGISTSLISFCYGVFIIIEALLGHKIVPGFATLATLIAFFSGMIMFMLGIIGEYIWRILDQVNNRPECVVDEIH